MWWIWVIVIILIVLLIGWVVGIFNRLIQLRNQVNNAWSQIDVQLQRRHDLIPNLVETVKGYMTYEQTTLQKVIEARRQAIAAREHLAQEGGPASGSLQEVIGAERQLQGALGNIFALAENYPQLRASENMQRLQEELSSTENKVAFARQSYNDSVMMYNTYQQGFPVKLLAHTFGHKSADFFEIKEDETRKAVKVQF